MTCLLFEVRYLDDLSRRTPLLNGRDVLSDLDPKSDAETVLLEGFRQVQRVVLRPVVGFDPVNTAFEVDESNGPVHGVFTFRQRVFTLRQRVFGSLAGNQQERQQENQADEV